MTRRAGCLALLVAVCAVFPAGIALSQGKKPPAKAAYDQYEPSRVLRTGRQDCMRNEETIGPWCVRACQKGYVAVPDSNPPRCRSIEPLPAGQIAGPIRREAGTQPKRPAPAKKNEKRSGER